MKLALDLDDVLCDFVGTWCQWLFTEGISDRLLTRADIDTYDFFHKNFGRKAHDFFLVNPQNLYENMVTPFSGSHDFVEWAKTEFDDITVLTHCQQKDAKAAKTKFIKEQFGLDKIKFSGGSREKHTFLDTDTILVDDYPHNVLQHVAFNDAHGICFNRNGVNGWDGFHKYQYLVDSNPIDHNLYWDSVESYAHLQIILAEIKEQQ